VPAARAAGATIMTPEQTAWFILERAAAVWPPPTLELSASTQHDRQQRRHQGHGRDDERLGPQTGATPMCDGQWTEMRAPIVFESEGLATETRAVVRAAPSRTGPIDRRLIAPRPTEIRCFHRTASAP
jgi:hypothetical protein